MNGAFHSPDTHTATQASSTQFPILSPLLSPPSTLAQLMENRDNFLLAEGPKEEEKDNVGGGNKLFIETSFPLPSTHAITSLVWSTEQISK